MSADYPPSVPCKRVTPSTSSQRLRGRRLVSWVALGALGVVLAAASMALGWRLAGPDESDTALGRVSFEVVPDTSFGVVDAYVPIADWGIRVNAFDAPYELHLEIRSLNRKGAIETAGGDLGDIEATRDELRDSAEGAVLRGFAWGLGATFAVALILWLLRTRFRPLGALAITVAGVGIIGSAVSLLLTSTTFDSRAFSSPSYYGRGPELAQLLAFAERQQDNDRYTSTFENALSNFSAYLAESPRVGEDGPGRAITVGSDIHANAPILSALPTFIEDEPVFLAGDFGVTGSEQEAGLIASEVADLSSEVVAVSGNHDSTLFMEALAEDGVSVLTTDGLLDADGASGGEDLVSMDGFEIAGFSDPLEWEGGADPESSERIFSFPELEDGEELEAQAKDDLVVWFESLPSEPDIVLVHQSGLAKHLATTLAEGVYAQPLTIVTGHNHIQQIDRYPGGSITVVNAGTLGAGGPLRVGQESAGLGQLHYGESDNELQSVDLIRVEPLSGQAQAERVVLDVACPVDEASDEVCHYEP